MPLQQTSGAASYDAFGGGVAAVPKYIEDYFSTFLYSGTGAAQTITNGIDLATKGGLVWYKRRSGVGNNVVVDTSRGMTSGSSPLLNTNTTDSQTAINNYVIANTTGFSFGSNATGTDANASGSTYVSWSIAKAPKFFDVVTWSGNGTIGRTISHSLGSAPGCIIVKRTNGVGDWVVYHRSLGATKAMLLNLTDSVYTWNVWNDTAPTSTVFSLNDASEVNGAGNTYVAYVLAHNAGGFGLTGTDNVISCGSFTTNGSGAATISLGYEPQWVMTKRTDSTGPWGLYDTMRGWSLTAQNYLLANDSGAEGVINATGFAPNATGFTTSSPFDASATYIYIAIRRGPMKVPTSGTSVFYPNASTGTITTGFPVDTMISAFRGGDTNNFNFVDRLRGFPSNNADTTNNKYIVSSSTVAETTTTTYTYGWTNTQYKLGLYGENLFYSLGRAPNTHDEVCYTGTGASTTDTIRVNHNLGVKPELLITKSRSAGSTNWGVYAPDILPKVFGNYTFLKLNLTDAIANSYYFDVTSTYVDYIRTGTSTNSMNDAGTTYVSYLFASCPGVSKVGSYTGNGSTQAIACGFTGGSRFVLIKATSTTGNWICVDTARGMTTSSNPVLYLNSTAAETATSGACITSTGGFTVDESKLTGVNTSGVSYIFLSYA